VDTSPAFPRPISAISRWKPPRLSLDVPDFPRSSSMTVRPHVPDARRRSRVRKRLAAGGNRIRTIGPSGATRPLKLCDSLLTSCWKEPDSNPRSPVTSSPIFGDTNLLVTNMEQGGVAIGGSRWRHRPRHSPAPVHQPSMREGAPLSSAGASGCGCRYRKRRWTSACPAQGAQQS
jgi:hypothetical protein